MGPTSPPAPVVETRLGPVRGTLVPEGDVAMFRGIAYAAPPVGPLRFMAPAPPPSWDEVRDATQTGPWAPQVPGVIERLWAGTQIPMDEDCLTLNVWAPTADGRPRPVMVWIHGGAFLTGSAGIPWYDGRGFVRTGDVVVVTINYRLGALGFLYLAGLGDARIDAGNAGILDQLAALEWVRDNIAGFGGDPGNITVFGESAGAMSIGTLLGIPRARGLFHKAILSSGASSNVSSAEKATAIAAELMDELGLQHAATTALDTIPVERLLAAQDTIASRHARRGLAFQPVIDGVTIPRAPLEAIAAGSAAGIPILAGTTAEEMRLFTALDPELPQTNESTFLSTVRSYFGDRTEAALHIYRAHQPEAGPADLWTQMATDAVFRVPALALLARHQTATAGLAAPAYAYLFTVRSTAFGGLLGSCHGLDVPFIFDIVDRPGVGVLTGDVPGAAELAHQMQRAWAAFAHRGDPSTDGLSPWPAYTLDARLVMELGIPSGVLADPDRHVRELWDV